MMLFYESRKRREKASARNAELENITVVLQQKDSYIDDLKNEQNELKREKEELRNELKEARTGENRERNKVISLYKQLSQSTVEKVKMKEDIAILEFHKCEVADCSRRKPPHDK